MEKSEKEQMVIDCLNTLRKMGRDKEMRDMFNDALRVEHRTNQQLVIGSLFKVIHDPAGKYDLSPTRFFDGRNEASGKRCSDINKHMTEVSVYWTELPFI